MFRVPLRCFQCGKQMKKGEAAIIINSLLVYHPDCYKKAREITFNGLTILREGWLDDATSRIEAFVSAADSGSIKDLNVFYDAWGKQLLVPELLKVIISDAKGMGVIGTIKDYQLKRKLRKVYNNISSIGTDYREGFGIISIQIKNRELFPVVDSSDLKDDPLDKLREEEKMALRKIVDNMKSIGNESKLLLDEARKIAKLLLEGERKELQKEIDDIKNQIQPCP